MTARGFSPAETVGQDSVGQDSCPLLRGLLRSDCGRAARPRREAEPLPTRAAARRSVRMFLRSGAVHLRRSEDDVSVEAGQMSEDDTDLERLAKSQLLVGLLSAFGVCFAT